MSYEYLHGMGQTDIISLPAEPVTPAIIARQSPATPMSREEAQRTREERQRVMSQRLICSVISSGGVTRSVNAVNDFIKKLNEETGPFIYIDVSDLSKLDKDSEKFLAWNKLRNDFASEKQRILEIQYGQIQTAQQTPAIPGGVSVINIRYHYSNADKLLTDARAAQGSNACSVAAPVVTSTLPLSLTATVPTMPASMVVLPNLERLPDWVVKGQARFKKEIHDLYKSSISRIETLLIDNGEININLYEISASRQSFLEWWKNYDIEGAAGWVALKIPLEIRISPAAGDVQLDEPAIYRDPRQVMISVPKKLFEFYKSNNGAQAPTKELLGFNRPLLAQAKEKWIWIAGGIVGVVILSKLFESRKQSPSVRRPEIESKSTEK